LKHMKLDDYRIVEFSTHGLLADETAGFGGLLEASILMTPPRGATEDDDGLLTTSEILALKLDADWVVMSACNTAAGSRPGAEALSGLAKAFFYAGARTLMVTHWPVNSDAAVLLTSTTFAELKSHPEISRAEAFRRAELALIDDPNQSHPSVWAPFIIVGEAGPLPAR
jgi:CHAT domain-containing protein